jgi:single-stranded-DNA-specific exonuclease
MVFMAIYLPFESQIKDIETCSTLLKKELDISTVTARLLVNRGITRIDEAKSFLYPSLDQLHDPFLLSDMDKAVQRLEKAIVDKEAIVIYGDYDVDGITAASILYLFLINKGANVEVYIPDRYQEGYGLNCQAIKHISKGGANLIVTVDCGITAFEEVELANKLGMDIIITDHHKCCNQLPNALAIINPLHHGYSYPFPHLAGVGVAAKVIEAMAGIEDVKKYLDLIALGTVADIVPLVDENRILVAKGLEMINHSPHPGIKALIQVSGLEDRIIDAGKIAFTLAPRLNAAGRISTAYLGFNLLSTQDYHEARHIAQKLDEENRQRQRIETELVDVCKKRILKHGSLCCDKIIVLEGQDWHTGVIGIAASKLVETFHRPCILISIQEDIGVGSARSIPGFNIYNALNQFSSLFIRFGGHEAAARIKLGLRPFLQSPNRVNWDTAKMAPSISFTDKFILPA